MLNLDGNKTTWSKGKVKKMLETLQRNQPNQLNKTELDQLRERPNYERAKHIDPDRICKEHGYFLANYTTSGIGGWVCPLRSCNYREGGRKPRAALKREPVKSLTDVNVPFIATRPDGRVMTGQIHWETFTKLVKEGVIEIEEDLE